MQCTFYQGPNKLRAKNNFKKLMQAQSATPWPCLQLSLLSSLWYYKKKVQRNFTLVKFQSLHILVTSIYVLRCACYIDHF